MKKLALLLCTAMVAGLLSQPAAADEPSRRFDRNAEAEQREETRAERKARKREETRQRREQRREDRREQEAREERRRNEVRPERRHGGAERAARTARQLNGGGRVLSVHPDGDGYKVRMLKNGEVRSYRVSGD